MKNLNLIYQKKGSNDCAVACVRMLIAFHGLKKQQTTFIKKQLCITKNTGTSVKKLISHLKNTGFEIKLTKLTPFFRLENPVVLLADVSKLWDEPYASGKHAIILFKLTKKYAWINDPYPSFGGTKKIKLEHLYKSLLKKQNNMLEINK